MDSVPPRECDDCRSQSRLGATTPSVIGDPNSLALHKPPLRRGDVESQVASVQVVTNVRGAVPSLSLVVVAYCEGEDLLALLAELRQQVALVDVPVDLVLVDNGLAEDVRQKASACVDTYVVARHNVGCSQGRNLGALWATGDALVFVDADARARPGFVGAALAAMRTSGVVAARGRVVAKGPWVPPHYDLGETAGASLITTEGVSVWRRDPFIAAGGFEASLYGMEGPVLCYRMNALHGVAVDAFRYEPGMVIEHDYAPRWPALFRKLARNEEIRSAVEHAYPEFAAFVRSARAVAPPRSPNYLLAAAARTARWVARWRQRASLPSSPK